MAKFQMTARHENALKKMIAEGAYIKHQLEAAGRYGHYEQFKYRLMSKSHGIIKGFGDATLIDLVDRSGIVEQRDAHYGSTCRREYVLKEEFRMNA